MILPSAAACFLARAWSTLCPKGEGDRGTRVLLGCVKGWAPSWHLGVKDVAPSIFILSEIVIHLGPNIFFFFWKVCVKMQASR